jgi:hypothetical protein
MLDGEGCISIATYLQSGKYVVTQLAVSIFQTDERLMKWLQFHYGGTVIPRKPEAGKRQGWSWSPGVSNLEKFLLAIIPYLIIKKKQALLALEFVRLGKCKTGPGSDNEQIKAKRLEMADRCSKLNNRESPTTNTSNV